MAGAVVCSFRKPTFDFHDVLVSLKRGRAQVNIQSLPHVERQGLGASWMKLINAIGLDFQRKKQFQRIVVNSSLDVNPLAMKCGWKSFVFLALGLGVNPMDAVLHDLGRGKDAVSEHSQQSTALHSEAGERLIEIRWYEGVPCLELTDHCSSWSVRRSLAHFLHMVNRREGKQEVVHFVPPTGQKGQTPIAQICDCNDINLNPIDSSILRNIHYAITWTLYFEELLHEMPYETTPIPQSLLLLQFEMTEKLHQTPTEILQSDISTIFPRNATLVANIMSALTSIWNSSEHQKLLNGLSGGIAHKPALSTFNRSLSNTTVQPTQSHSNPQPPDLEKAIEAIKDTSSPSISEKPSPANGDDITFDLYPALRSSPTFQSLSLACSPSAIITTKISDPHSGTAALGPTSAIIDLDDQSRPEGLLARLVIALSAMRRSTAPKSWVTSIATGALKYKVGPDAGVDMGRKLLGYEGGMLRLE